ncbi:MAG: tetratricopeptide repeat protein [Prolixibacteraceae bacterium]|nr:tetratricopeptide repeat protein [Prolixibacteraceae bacterium]
MNKVFLLILSLLITSTIAASPADTVKAANEAYASKEFEKAILMYESVVDSGYVSASVYFNLGNAYYKSNNIPKSILNYERAKLLAPNDEDIKFNLTMANQFVIDKIEPLPQPFFVKWGQDILNIFSSNKWALFSIAAFVLTLILALIFLFSKRITFRKMAFGLAVFMLIISIISFVFAARQKAKITDHNHAIIFNPTVTVKASPDEGGTDLFVIHEGLKVEIEQKLNNWVEIKLGDGNSGWVKTEVLEEI